MPKDKDFKRLVRRRMDKTGESYSAARAQLLNPPPLLPAEYEKLAGMSNAAVSKRTGKDWLEWARTLDADQVLTLPHREIAKHVHAAYAVPEWWAQMVTVAYERFRGLREVGQRRGGGYDVNKSKTVPVPVTELYRAFEDETVRARWLPDLEITIRTATAAKSMRIRLADDTPLDVHFSAKGDAKSSVSVQHRNLPSGDAAAEMKAYWGDRLGLLSTVLSEG